MGISIWAPLKLRRTWNLEVGSYTGDLERRMKEGSSNRASISEGLHEEDMEGRLLYWRPQKICKVRLCKWVSTSIVALHLGNMEEHFFLGLLSEKSLFSDIFVRNSKDM
jgi:hypothetical protein